MNNAQDSDAARMEDRLLEAIPDLRNAFEAVQDVLAVDTLEDFSRLLEAADRLESLLGQDGTAVNVHDLMNILTALRGYAEMLREDVKSDLPDLGSRLETLLQHIESTRSVHTDAGGSEKRALTVEPGFSSQWTISRKIANCSPGTCPTAGILLLRRPAVKRHSVLLNRAMSMSYYWTY